MASPPEDTPHHPVGHPIRHTVVIWLVLLAALAGAFAATVIALNATLYSAGGFVGSYLAAVARHDVDGALATPGVVASGGVAGGETGTQLLTPDALGELHDIRLLSDEDLGAGFHLVEYEYTLAGEVATSSFQVQRTGTRLGLFPTWAFVQSPLSILQVTPLHAAEFTVNGVDLTASGPSQPTGLRVLSPGVFEISHSSQYLEARPLLVAVTAGSSIVPARLDIQANQDFVDAVQSEVDDLLDECTTQEVLFPTGCPFGQELSNRVESVPEWSMVDYPRVTIEPGQEPGTWVIPGAQGNAHLRVEVRSLFDGTVSTFDEDVPFALDWVITFDGDRVDIQAR